MIIPSISFISPSHFLFFFFFNEEEKRKGRERGKGMEAEERRLEFLIPVPYLLSFLFSGIRNSLFPFFLSLQVPFPLLQLSF